MAIHAHYRASHLTVKDAYIRIERIWGSKEEGWNAWTSVRENATDKEHKELFHVTVPYVEDENPFKALYGKIQTLPFILSDSELDPVKPVEPVAEVSTGVAEETTPVEAPKKKKSKK